MLNSVSASKSAGRKGSGAKSKVKPKPFRTQVYKVARWMHVYMSTATLLVILFFAATGILLNHPDLVFGTEPVTQEIKGSLEATWLETDSVNWLAISEYMRNNYGVQGQVADYWHDSTEGQLNFVSPGYLADVYFSLASGDFTLYTESQGMLAFMKDLHKGSNTGSTWKWTIDVFAIFLILVSLSGLTLTLVLKKLRVKGLLTMVIGSVIAGIAIVLSI